MTSWGILMGAHLYTCLGNHYHINASSKRVLHHSVSMLPNNTTHIFIKDMCCAFLGRKKHSLDPLFHVMIFLLVVKIRPFFFVRFWSIMHLSLPRRGICHIFNHARGGMGVFCAHVSSYTQKKIAFHQVDISTQYCSISWQLFRVS